MCTYNESEAHLGRALVDLVHRQIAQLVLVFSVSVVIFWLQVGRCLISSFLFLLKKLTELEVQFLEHRVIEMSDGVFTLHEEVRGTVRAAPVLR